MSTVTNLRQTALRGALVRLIVLTIATFVLLGISALLGGADITPMSHPLQWLTTLDRDAAAGTLSGAAQIVAGVLGIAITVVAIVVQLAATRSGNQITDMFFREPINWLIMSLFVLTTLQCLWISITFRDASTAAL